jgi:hypothetical protein
MALSELLDAIRAGGRADVVDRVVRDHRAVAEDAVRRRDPGRHRVVLAIDGACASSVRAAVVQPAVRPGEGRRTRLRVARRVTAGLADRPRRGPAAGAGTSIARRDPRPPKVRIGRPRPMSKENGP